MDLYMGYAGDYGFTKVIKKMMNRKYKISIVTPSYNQAKFLEKTIQSVLNQNYENKEYIIIDGESSDDSVEIIKKYNNNLKYYVSEKDKGQSDAINKGFTKATGDIYAYLCSDDIYLPGTLEHIAYAFDKYWNDVDIVYGHSYIIDEAGKIINFSTALPFHLKESFYGVFSIPQQSCFWKKEVHEKVGGFNIYNKSCMDGEFFINAKKMGFRFKKIDMPLACFRIHKESITGSGKYDKEYFKDAVRIKKSIIEGESPFFKNVIFKMFYRIKYLPYKIFSKIKYILIWIIKKEKI